MNGVPFGIAFQSARWHEAVTGYDEIGDAQIGHAVAGASAGNHSHTEIRLDPFQLRCAVLSVQLRITAAAFPFRERSMEKGEVRRIAFAFKSLQVVAVLDGLGDIEMVLRNGGPFVVGKERNALLSSHIREYDASGFFAWVSPMVHFQ